jgi:DNA-directed RNA polymerase specialized sigma24 family protein
MANKLSNSQKILFEQNYSHVLKAVSMYYQDFYMAEEATQEAFLQAFKNINYL